MVCIREYLTTKSPSIIPRIRVNIYKNSHKFGDTKCRMCVVEVDRDLFSKITKRTVSCKVVSDNALKSSGTKEILLFKSKNFTFYVVV